MNEHLVQLVDLSNIDKELENHGTLEAEINKSLNELLKEEEENKKTIEALEEEVKSNKQKKLKSELHLSELSQKLKEIDKRSNIVKNEKEVRALQLEEDITKEQINFANEEIERFDRIEKAKKEEIAKLKKTNEEIEQKIKKAKEESRQEIEDLENRRKELYEKREKLVSKMPHKIHTFYQKIKRWAGNTTVVEVKKQACSGCHMRLNDRVYADVIKSEEIINCPMCGRILYIKPE